MAVKPASQLSPYRSLDPQQAASADPLNFQTQHAVKQQPEGCLQADNVPGVVFSHAGQHTSIFCNEPLESCPH